MPLYPGMTLLIEKLVYPAVLLRGFGMESQVERAMRRPFHFSLGRLARKYPARSYRHRVQSHSHQRQVSRGSAVLRLCLCSPVLHTAIREWVY